MAAEYSMIRKNSLTGRVCFASNRQLVAVVFELAAADRDME